VVKLYLSTRSAQGEYKGKTMNAIFSWLGARLSEPSTYAGIAAIFAASGHTVDPGLIQNIMVAATGVTGILAAVIPGASSAPAEVKPAS
jgi:uncharacterized membrane protein YccC